MHWKLPLWGGKKVELRETQRAVTAFGGLVVFFEFLPQVGYREGREQASTVSFYFTQRHRSSGNLHRIFALGGGWSTAACTHEFAACGCGLAGVAGDGMLS